MANASTTSPTNPGHAKPGAPGQSSVIIKKYANRRLYNTETSSYITLDHLAVMTREGRDFQVFDARSGEDITRAVLTQIVMEGEANGQTMLPTSFLRQIIALYGDSMQSMVPHYLEASMSAFAENQVKFRDAALKPFEHLARQNLAMFQAAAGLMTGARPLAGKPAADGTAGKPAVSETEQLREQVAALQARIDGMQS